MEEKEIWKSLDCIDYPNYEVSNFGRVKSLNYNHTGKEKILKPVENRYGYLKVALFQNTKEKRYTVHRLVASAFIPNDNNLPCVNHKDENKKNNNVSNLEWVTYKENINYGTRNERARKANRIPILQYTKEGVFIRDWDSAKQASEELGINSSNIASCCKEKLKTCGGFIWRYKE